MRSCPLRARRIVEVDDRIWPSEPGGVHHLAASPSSAPCPPARAGWARPRLPIPHGRKWGSAPPAAGSSRGVHEHRRPRGRLCNACCSDAATMGQSSAVSSTVGSPQLVERAAWLPPTVGCSNLNAGGVGSYTCAHRRLAPPQPGGTWHPQCALVDLQTACNARRASRQAQPQHERHAAECGRGRCSPASPTPRSRSTSAIAASPERRRHATVAPHAQHAAASRAAAVDPAVGTPVTGGQAARMRLQHACGGSAAASPSAPPCATARGHPTASSTTASCISPPTPPLRRRLLPASPPKKRRIVRRSPPERCRWTAQPPPRQRARRSASVHPAAAAVTDGAAIGCRPATAAGGSWLSRGSPGQCASCGAGRTLERVRAPAAQAFVHLRLAEAAGTVAVLARRRRRPQRAALAATGFAVPPHPAATASACVRSTLRAAPRAPGCRIGTPRRPAAENRSAAAAAARRPTSCTPPTCADARAWLCAPTVCGRASRRPRRRRAPLGSFCGARV